MLLIGVDSRSLSRWRVIDQPCPDVAVVEAGPDDLEEVARSGRLVMGHLRDHYLRVIGDTSLLDGLDEDVRAFVDSWRDRTRSV